MRACLSLLLAATLLSPSLASAADVGAVRALVEAWKEAQNKGDLAAYDALYAKRFSGVRRSGPRVRRFDRAGWMKDRARMFGKPMSVEVEDVQVTSMGTEADVRFTQTFAQGNYRDAGPKHLVVVREGGGLKIAIEELLESKRELPSHARGDLVGVVAGSVVLLGDATQGEASRAKPTLAHGADGVYAILTAIPAAKAPRPDDVGRAVEVIDAKGARCETRVSSLATWRGVVPHFGTVQAWTDEHASDDRVAKDLDVEGSAPRLAGVLGSECKRGLVARRKGATARIATPEPLARGPLSALALRATKKLPAYVALAAELKKTEPDYYKAMGNRWHEDKDVTISTLDVEVAGQPERWLSVSIASYEGCATLGGELWALFRVGGPAAAPTLTLVNDPTRGVIQPALAVDLDGDGWPELVYDHGGLGDLGLVAGVLWSNGGKYDRKEDVTVPYHDCPC